MLKKEIHIDTIYLATLSCIGGVSIYRYLTGDYVLSINNYAAFILLTGVIIYRTFSPGKGKYLVLGLLILSTLNIINFSIEVFRANIGYGSNNSNIEKFGINFIFLVLTIIYCRLNKAVIKPILKKTEEEEASEEKNNISFYLNKFREMNEIDFEKAYSHIEDFPVVARVCLRKVKEEKELNISQHN